MGREKILRYTLFCVGAGVALAASLVMLGTLYLNVLGTPVTWFEGNGMLATVEMAALVLAVGTCVGAAEMYWKYLGLREMMYVEDS